MSSGSRPSQFPLTKSGPLRLYSMQELINLPAPKFLINGVLPEGALAVLYGAPGAGKTFVAADFAMSVATNLPWQGKTVDSGYVLYVSGEGGSGIGKRGQAWCEVHDVNPRRVRIAWLPEPISIYSDSQALDILLTRIEEEVQETPRFIIIDTLARCFDGDENKQEDMGRFVAGIDRLRREFGATLLIVHHTRLDGNRERGNTALRGAADTMIELKRNDKSKIVTLSCSKQKDWEEFDSIDMTMDIVELKDSTLQNPKSSCVMRPLITETSEETRTNRVEAVLGMIIKAQPVSFTDLRAHAEAAGMSPATLKRALIDLKEMGLALRVLNKWQIISV